MVAEDPIRDMVDPPTESHDVDDIQEQMIDGIHEKTTEVSLNITIKKKRKRKEVLTFAFQSNLLFLHVISSFLNILIFYVWW